MNKNEMFEQINHEIDLYGNPNDVYLLKQNVKTIIEDFLSSLVDGLVEAMKTTPT